MNEQPGTPEQFDSRLSEETIGENKEILAKIGSDSMLKAAIIKGSIYFWVSGVPASGVTRGGQPRRSRG